MSGNVRRVPVAPRPPPIKPPHTEGPSRPLAKPSGGHNASAPQDVLGDLGALDAAASNELDLESELGDIMSEASAAELVECLAEDPALGEAHAPVAEGQAEFPEAAPGDTDMQAAASIASEMAEVAAAVGLQNDEVTPGSSAASSGDPPPVPPAAPAEVPPWQLMGEISQTGYYYYQGRSVLRVQRGKPARSVTVTCYRHPRCTMLLSESRCPSDDVLKEWAFAVGDGGVDRTPGQAKDLAAQHMALGKGQWSAKAKAKAR